jgi:hypothetical protein
VSEYESGIAGAVLTTLLVTASEGWTGRSRDVKLWQTTVQKCTRRPGYHFRLRVRPEPRHGEADAALTDARKPVTVESRQVASQLQCVDVERDLPSISPAT